MAQFPPMTTMPIQQPPVGNGPPKIGAQTTKPPMQPPIQPGVQTLMNSMRKQAPAQGQPMPGGPSFQSSGGIKPGPDGMATPGIVDVGPSSDVYPTQPEMYSTGGIKPQPEQMANPGIVAVDNAAYGAQPMPTRQPPIDPNARQMMPQMQQRQQFGGGVGSLMDNLRRRGQFQGQTQPVLQNQQRY